MRGKTVNLIAAKELRDTLRDRRTLFVALVLPLLLYPALLLGLTQIIGATQRNLEEERQKVWFDCAEGATELLQLLSEEQLAPFHAQKGDEMVRSLIQGALAEMDGDGADEARARLRAVMAEEGYDAAVVCEEGFGRRIDSYVPAHATLLFDPTDEPSKTARRKINAALETFRERKRDGLAKAHPEQETRLRFMEQPVAFAQHEVATASQKGAYSFAPMLGMLIVIMALTGAFYPAVDLVAGEKERGTMETLLVAPVTRTEIVLGKFKAIWVIAVVTALLNLLVMGLTFSKLASMIGTGQVAFSIPPAAILAVTIILVPTAALFAALALALSSFATSYKEGQHYLSPLFLVAMPLSMVGMLPNIEISYALALVPVANVVLLVKAMLLGGEVLWPALVAAGATAAYAALGLAVAVSIFRRESVLFRGGAGKSYDAKSLEAARSGRPSEGSGVLLFFVVIALMFFLSGGQTDESGNVRELTVADAIRAFALAQAAIVSATILIALRNKVDVKETFALRPFRPALVPVVMGAALCGLVLVLGIYGAVMPEREPAGIEKIVNQLVTGSPWIFFLLLAVVAPICEELLCRGYMMSSFRARFGLRGAVLLSAFLFGALHLDLMRFPATFAAGLLLGFVLVSTRSIFASILFHMTWNGVIAAAAMGRDLLGELVAWKLVVAGIGLILAVAALRRAAVVDKV